MKNKILVTGSEGFIGSHLVEKLVKEGFNIKALVYYNSFNSWGWLDTLEDKIKNNIEVVLGDVRSNDSVDKALKDCNKVAHLASLIAIPYSYETPKSYVDTNISGTLNILQSSLKNGIETIVHTSTSEVYGTAQKIPITEEHPLVGQSPYSASKIAADQLAQSFFTSFNLPIITIRPFNTYGPRQSARAFIPTIIMQILDGKKEISLGSTTPSRDLTFISDTVNGFLAALDANCFGETINLGTGKDFSVAEVFDAITSIMQVNVDIKTDTKRIRPKNSEVLKLLASNDKAMKLLNWKPEFNDKEGLLKGLSLTIDWFSENKQFYKSNIYNV